MACSYITHVHAAKSTRASCSIPTEGIIRLGRGGQSWTIRCSCKSWNCLAKTFSYLKSEPHLLCQVPRLDPVRAVNRLVDCTFEPKMSCLTQARGSKILMGKFDSLNLSMNGIKSLENIIPVMQFVIATQNLPQSYGKDRGDLLDSHVCRGC